ncbi:hypothetical protein [Roseateles cavernae]|uniref:hypothetical protein n=1 Tax=Roseateles cavernae TaxID=3153578 RepID=UPI0032E4C382
MFVWSEVQRNGDAMPKLSVRGVVAACLIGVLGSRAAAIEMEVPALNTYNMTPFVTSAGAGLAADLVAYLNYRLRGVYRLQLLHVPRERLVRIELHDPKAFSGVALFLAPQFVDDQDQRRFLWTSPLFEDRNVLAFLGSRRREIQHLEDLAGLRFGGVLGNRYSGLDEMVQAGVLTRENSTSALSSLRKVCLGRVDFTQMSRLMLESMLAESGCAGQLGHSPVPQSPPFGRRILIGVGNVALARRINEVVDMMPCDPQWQAVARGYGIASLACPSRR